MKQMCQRSLLYVIYLYDHYTTLYPNASQAESRSRLVRLVLYACCFILDMHTIESAVGYGFKVVLYGAYKAVESKPTPR